MNAGWTWEGCELSEGYVAAVYDETGERIADYLTEDRARLIAAAPALLAALEAFRLKPDAIVGAQGADIILRVPVEAISKAAAAIAKATGAQS